MIDGVLGRAGWRTRTARTKQLSDLGLLSPPSAEVAQRTKPDPNALDRKRLVSFIFCSSPGLKDVGDT